MQLAEHKNHIIGEFTARRIDSELMIAIPAIAAVSAGARFTLYLKNDGTLQYQPVTFDDNPCTNGTYANLDFIMDLSELGNYGISN
ncbi:hypothetical protein [Lactiplantibacillus fabifermentans]|uniref:Uncharacterized protein n=2 Tax=Lactiplantibacillus fabifermentans TaxID=483011 RepID=A0A0R2NRM8_9LACO|nr:hypothetical protein [Lactiplantibacillus fabifermentans]ETY73291.1 hypothetical protein LFAB_13215 [Lactiplantibacillus fabifermentans T30PCM01]KRO28340.1 hypothetical protein DY78_GL002470 [Lactiplantibacillus fabifermentans DSM 21115]